MNSSLSGKTGPVTRGHTPCLAECLNRILRNYARLWLVGAAALAFVGCSSLRPIASKPPASAIVFSQPVTVRRIFLKATFPSGEYRPLFEDNGGFYFQSPTKVVANDLGGSMYDGGIYVKRGSNDPTHWYLIVHHGEMTMGRFGSVPPHESRP